MTDTADAAKLLPCPFCGRSARVQSCSGGGYEIVCLGCYATIFNESEIRAHKLWNTRPQPAPLEGEPVLLDPVRQTAISGLAERPKVEDAPTTKHDEAMALACIHTWDQNPLADHVGIDGPLLKQVAKLFLSTASKLAEREAELGKAYEVIAHTLTPTDCFCGDIEVVRAAHARATLHLTRHTQ